MIDKTMSPKPEFIAFIKNFIVNRCITECVLNAYESNCDNILEFSMDSIMWDKVFQQLSPLIKYYSMLVPDAAYEQNRLATIYAQPTFQEYVDKKICVDTISTVDYQAFIKNMKNEGFRKALVAQYTVACSKNTLKNHFIYLTNLYFMKELSGHKYFTTEEEGDMVQVINAIPYFDYVTKSGVSTDIEKRALQYIQKYLFV
jgi:hypothetical protein